MIETPLTRYALSIARNAHAGQTDKAGRPYIEHPLHVAESMDTEVETCAALLHDVVEGTNWTLEALADEGMPTEGQILISTRVEAGLEVGISADIQRGRE